MAIAACSGVALSGNQATCTTSSLGAGNHTIEADYDGAGSFANSSGTLGQSVNRAATSLLYNGGQIVVAGVSLTLGAQLSGRSACLGGRTINFSLDANPLSGSVGAYALGSFATSLGGAVSRVLSTAGWQEGVYTLTAAFAGDGNCVGSSDSATLTVAVPGEAANGGSWYTLAASGRVNLGFTVRAVPNTTNQYKGQLLLINNGKWRLKGTLSSYSRQTSGTIKLNGGGTFTCSTTNPCASSSGNGNLYWWDTSNPAYPLGYWHQTSDSPVTFSITFVAGSGGKNSNAAFGIIINHSIQSGEPSNLPNAAPVSLKGGSINAN
jgi:hypothetical protein